MSLLSNVFSFEFGPLHNCEKAHILERSRKYTLFFHMYDETIVEQTNSTYQRKEYKNGAWGEWGMQLHNPYYFIMCRENKYVENELERATGKAVVTNGISYPPEAVGKIEFKWGEAVMRERR